MKHYKGRKLYGLSPRIIDELEAEQIQIRHLFPMDPRGHGHPRETDPIAVILYFPYNPADPEWDQSEPRVVIRHKAETATQAVLEARDMLWQGL